MKKKIAAISAMVLALTGMVLWQFQPQSIMLSADEPEYTVTIPAAVKLGESAEITAKNNTMKDGAKVSVNFTRNTTNNGHSALFTSDFKNCLEYKITLYDNEIQVGSNILNLTAGQEDTESAVLFFHEPETRPYPGKYSGVVGFTVKYTEPSAKTPNITVPGYGAIDATADNPEVQTDVLINPEENPCNFVYELVIDGETLFTSEPIAPGEKLESFTMSRALPAGNYPAEFRIHTYALDTGAPMNSSTIKFELRVKEG